MKTIAHYASLVKFSHTLFGLPFALLSYTYALWSSHTPFDPWVLLKVVLAMVFARNAAMGLNRYADRHWDAQNPRTARREIPAGILPTRHVLGFVIVNALLFLGTAAWINILALMLAPIALAVLLGYSYTKRYTAWCHLILGIALGIAAPGAYIAVTGQLAIFPILLAGLVVSWVAGFDIIYALQDLEFDRSVGLHSIPARFGVHKSIAISLLLHLFSTWSVIIVGLFYGAGSLYWIGALFFVGMLLIQHLLATPRRLDRIGPMFGVVNGLTSVGYALCAILDLWFHYHG